MTTTSSTPFTTGRLARPLDASGRLLHEDDPAAQLALSLAHLERDLADAGRAPTDLARLDVLTTDPAALASVADVLDERLAVLGARPLVTTEAVDRLAVPGMLVALRPVLGPAARPAAAPAEALRGLCGGAVHLPGDAAYDAARTPWNVAVDQRPAAVAVPRSVDDVVEVVRAAVDAGLRVAPQSTGHGASPLPARGLADVVLVRLHELTGVTVDPAARSARVVGGTLWRDVVQAAAPHGLAALHGSAPDVAVAGYVLGGGLSFYARQHGLAAHSVTAVEIVLPDGSLVRADRDQHADLFWAVRGGGGNLGVVVAIELDLLELPDVQAGMLLWDAERAADVLRTWRELTRTVPDSVTTSVRVMSFPPMPELPPFLSGRRVVVVDGAVLEDDESAAAILAPLRALAPEVDTFGPTPAVSDHAVLHRLDDEALAALLAVVGPGSTSPLMFAELRHLGGALARPSARAGAIGVLPGEYSLFCVAVAPGPEAAAVGRAAAADVVRAMAPWSMAARVLNFAEDAVDTSSGFDPEAWARLASVRHRVDPHRTMVAAHQV